MAIKISMDFCSEQCQIGVMRSVDNRKLLIRSIPRDLPEDDVTVSVAAPLKHWSWSQSLRFLYTTTTTAL
jgi:hypothetical protein